MKNFWMKNWGVEREKRMIFFVNSAYKMAMFLNRHIYDNNNKNIYMFIYKKEFKKMSTPF